MTTKKKHAMKKAAKARKVYRDARTGEFTTEKKARRRPSQTVRESV